MECATAFNLVDGKQLAGDRRDSIFNPARFDELVGHVEIASGRIVEQAVAAAEAAFPAWAARGLAERKELLLEAGRKVESAISQKDLASLLTSEQGKILSEAQREVGGTIPMIRLNVDYVDAAISDRVTADERGRNILVYDPIGVVAVITPWNWPVLLSVVAIIPALLAGNCVVVKPAPNTPLAISETVYAMASVLPPGVLNIIQGGGDVGSHLVAHPAVGKITFVGSVASGKKVYQAAGATSIKRLALELGGNDPAIVFEDTKIDDEVIRAIIGAAFMTSGQVCMAIKRLYVHSDIIDEFTDRLVEALSQNVVGDGNSPDVSMGPLNNEMQLRKVQKMLEGAKAGGADIRTVGKRHNGTEWARGYFMLPSIALNAPEYCELVQEEQFGPVLPILSFTDTDDVIRRANDTKYGLSASVWSSDIDRAFDVSRRVEAGKIWINQHGLGGLDFGIAVGGVKNSGLGVHYGPEGIQAFTNRRLLTDRQL